MRKSTAAVSSQQDMVRFFFRLIFPDGRACLLCRSSVRIFDAAGRMVTVRRSRDLSDLRFPLILPASPPSPSSPPSAPYVSRPDIAAWLLRDHGAILA